MNQLTILIILICFSLTRSNGQIANTRSIKIKRSYSATGKLIDETYYYKGGQKAKHLRFNVSLGHHFRYTVDTLAEIYKYDSAENKIREYGYRVRGNKKEEISLECEYYLDKKGRIILKKYFVPGIKDELFRYNDYGDLIKEKNKGEAIYLTDYEYTKDSLQLKKTKYQRHRILPIREFVYRIQFKYDTLQRLSKTYYYDYNHKLKIITDYEYDLNNHVIHKKETDLDIYTNEKQRRDKVSEYIYEYNSHGLILKEVYVDHHSSSPATTFYRYEFY